MIPPPAQQNRDEIATKNTVPDTLFTEIGCPVPYLFRVEPEGDRAVVREADLHIGAECAGFDRGVLLAADLDQPVEVRGGLIRCRAPGKAGAGTLLRVGCQRELWHEQQATGYVANATVHAAFIVRKYPVAQ